MRNQAKHNLLEALRRLRVFESLWSDLEYSADDPRGAIPDAEMPAELVAERELLERDVTARAAELCGEDPIAVAMFADTPRSDSNPYRIARVREAVAMFVGERFA